ncbi:hypothetical protein EVAR_7757_1 [Eumeta japonica]|uniref:Uncharacterized protein n=1 Tax=Eumeta variegata TaxID=151549 RepID=A0A4C1TK90_EUMVA|nr:hypothetical protein EVAR_7757_1 [Eumeta japonica]
MHCRKSTAFGSKLIGGAHTHSSCYVGCGLLVESHLRALVLTFPSVMSFSLKIDVNFNPCIIFDSDPSHTFNPTLEFDSSPVLNFSSGVAFDSDPGPVFDSALNAAFNSNSVHNSVAVAHP